MSIERGSRLYRQVEVMTSASGIWNIAENQSSVKDIIFDSYTFCSAGQP